VLGFEQRAVARAARSEDGYAKRDALPSEYLPRCGLRWHWQG
jgi:hypothetical protein